MGKTSIPGPRPVECVDQTLVRLGKSVWIKWGCIKTNLAIFGRMNIHLPVIWGSLGYQGFDSYPNEKGVLN